MCKDQHGCFDRGRGQMSSGELEKEEGPSAQPSREKKDVAMVMDYNGMFRCQTTSLAAEKERSHIVCRTIKANVGVKTQGWASG